MANPTKPIGPAGTAPTITAEASARVLRDAPTGLGHHLLRRPALPMNPSTTPATGRTPPEAAAPAPSAPPMSDPPAAPTSAADTKAGYQAGYEEGLRAGAEAARAALHDARQELRATFEGAIARVQALASALHDEVAGRLDAAEEDMLALCHEVVARILGDAVVRPEVLRTLLQHATRELRGRPLVAVHLHPDDLDLLTQGSGDMRALQPDGARDAPKVEWVASPGIALGGMVLHSPEGGLDARLETQLDALRQTVLHTRAARRARHAPATVGDPGAALAEEVAR